MDGASQVFPLMLILAFVLVIGVVGLVLALMSSRKRRGGPGRAQFPAAGDHAVKQSGPSVITAPSNAKRCPVCQSVYTDRSLSYCLTDGATLVGEDDNRRERDPGATAIYPGT